MQPYNSNDMTMVWKNYCSISSNFHMLDNQSIAVHAFPILMLTLLSVDIYIYILFHGRVCDPAWNTVWWLVGFYGISTFVVYLMPNPFYTINQFYFKQFNLAWVHSLSKTFLFQAIQFSQAVLFQTIQFSMSTQFVKNISISSYSV